MSNYFHGRDAHGILLMIWGLNAMVKLTDILYIISYIYIGI